MHIPKLAREWRTSSNQSSSAPSPTSSTGSGDNRSFTPATSIDYSAHVEMESDPEQDLIHEAFNERARNSLGIVSKPQTQFQPYYNEPFVSAPQVDLADWQGKLDGVEDGLLNFLSFADSWHAAAAPSPTSPQNKLVAKGQLDISLSIMSAQEEARRQIEAYCRR